jgi:MFS family permease
VSGDAPPQLPHDSAAEGSLLSPTFAVVMVASFLYFTSIGSLLPTLPRYVEDELGGGGLQVGIGVGAFAVSAALLRPWVGSLGDRKGRRILAVGGSIVVAVSIFTYAAAGSLWVLVLARLLTGAGEAAVFVGVATAAQDLAPDHRRGEAASYFSVALYGGLAVGPALGEALVDQGFGVVWAVSGGCAALAALVALWIPRGRTVEHTGGRKFLQRDALWPGVILLLGLIPFTAFATFVPLFADEIGLDSVGGVLAVYAGLVLIVRIFGARLPDRLGWQAGSTLALCGVTVGIWLVAALGSTASIWLAAVGLGAGMSLLYPSLFTAVMAAAPPDERSHAVGTFSVFFDLSQGLGAACVGLVVSLSGGSERAGFGAAGAMAFVGLVVQWRLRSRIGRAHGPPDPATAPAAAG